MIVELVETVAVSDFAEMREAVIPADVFSICLVPQARGPPVLA